MFYCIPSAFIYFCLVSSWCPCVTYGEGLVVSSPFFSSCGTGSESMSCYSDETKRDSEKLSHSSSTAAHHEFQLMYSFQAVARGRKINATACV